MILKKRMIYLYSKNKTSSVIGREESWAWSWQVICNICDLLFRLKINTYYSTRSPLCLLSEAFLSPFTLAAFLDGLPEVLVLSFLFSKQAENRNLPFKPLVLLPFVATWCCYWSLILWAPSYCSAVRLLMVQKLAQTSLGPLGGS